MNEPWPQATKDRWFLGALALGAFGVVWLLWPFFEVLVYAAVVAVVAEPLHRRLTQRLRGHRTLAAVLTAVAFALLVAVPLAALVFAFARQAFLFATQGLQWVSDGHLATQIALLEAEINARIASASGGRAAAVRFPALGDALQEAVTTALSITSGLLPQVLSGLASAVIGLVIFVFSVVTLLAEGPRLAAFVSALTPLDDRYESQLIAVFREFAFNMVVGVFVVALAQGLTATVGYWLMGVPRPLFFGGLTGLTSFVPVIGTAIVALPLVVWTASTHGFGTALALGAWAVFVVGTVDNVLRPLVIRGSSNIHPLPVFLAVFGGIWWMGIPGALVGPVILAMFLALARIYREEFVPRARAARMAERDGSGG